MKNSLKPSGLIIVFIAFIFSAIGCASTCQKTCAAPAKKSQVKAVDTDKNGKPDVWYHTASDKKTYKVEVDTNNDGRPDITHERQADGKDAILIDSDKDGRADLMITGKNGVFESAVVDDNKDGKFDKIINNSADFKKWVNAKDPKVNTSIEKLQAAEKGNPTILFKF